MIRTRIRYLHKNNMYSRFRKRSNKRKNKDYKKILKEKRKSKKIKHNYDLDIMEIPSIRPYICMEGELCGFSHNMYIDFICLYGESDGYFIMPNYHGYLRGKSRYTPNRNLNTVYKIYNSVQEYNPGKSVVTIKMIHSHLIKGKYFSTMLEYILSIEKVSKKYNLCYDLIDNIKNIVGIYKSNNEFTSKNIMITKLVRWN